MSAFPSNLSGQNTLDASVLAAGGPTAAASTLAALAVQALIDEANLTPKPALVDGRGAGAHADLTLELMHRSARSLFPCFEAIATVSVDMVPSRRLRERLGAIGRMGERNMFTATRGANSHRGAIWSLGLLVSGAVLCPDSRDSFAIASAAGRIARYPDSRVATTVTNGARVQRMFGAAGARGEAQQGFPHVIQIGFPTLLRARSRGVAEKHARLDALMAIMADLDDTCLLHRGGVEALRAAQQGAQGVLDEGGTSTARGLALLLELDAELLRMNASPGGSADLLAATLFLDSITRPSAVPRIAEVSFGGAELWKN